MRTKLTLIGAALTALPLPSAAFDRDTVEALTACHNYVWDVPEFVDLPNAAVSVWPGMVNDATMTIMWNVTWDDPMVKAAGICTYADGEVIGYEQY
ncbi:hypothetical protein [Yoonia sp. 208BN28-4]|uniref:hypothetical protein n=1 Tax=Yoonia sp. 208BN28-4 TaxID=3126505 RepID=UPI0030B65F51